MFSLNQKFRNSAGTTKMPLIGFFRIKLKLIGLFFFLFLLLPFSLCICAYIGMALITLHATCCKSSDLADVQTGLDEMDLNDIDKYTLPLLANPAYKKRMSDVLRDFQRLDYF